MTAFPYIIMSAPNGARRQKKDHPEIPIRPDEMAHCAEQILDSGASILHLHVRDTNNNHSLDTDRYRASIKAVKDVVGKKLIIQTTTEAVSIYSPHQQMEMVRELKPEAISMALRELCPSDEDISVFSNFLKWAKAEHIFSQYILYNPEDYQRFEKYRKMGVFHDDDPFVLFVMGSYAGPTPDTAQLMDIAKETSTPWAACGFSENEKQCINHAAEHNGHIRVGFENNIWREDGSLLENNGEMIRYASHHSGKRPIANAADVRNLFDLRG
ncbi:MAG: 3-keto-5-aminohexanoate cleavage protein [Emcibacteraceae bacterium]|nr:3-keto-5-aminohexanoate cleavage protein [Emcibacteraceae bacterium]